MFFFSKDMFFSKGIGFQFFEGVMFFLQKVVFCKNFFPKVFVPQFIPIFSIFSDVLFFSQVFHFNIFSIVFQMKSSFFFEIFFQKKFMHFF